MLYCKYTHTIGEGYASIHRHFNLGFDLYLSRYYRDTILAHRHYCMDYKFTHGPTIKTILNHTYHKKTNPKGSFFIISMIGVGFTRFPTTCGCATPLPLTTPRNSFGEALRRAQSQRSCQGSKNELPKT